MNLTVSIKDVGPSGVQLAGDLGPNLERPTLAQIVALYLAAHPEDIAVRSWTWYAARRVAADAIKGVQS